MNLPPYDPIRMELENVEDLRGTQESKEVLDPAHTILWFTSKQMTKDRKLKDYFGANEKTKVVVKLGRIGAGPPAREPRFSQEQQKEMMLYQHRRREALSKLKREDE